MRRLGLFLLTLSLTALPTLSPAPSSAAGQPGPVTVLSYNVRAHNSGEGLHPAFRFPARRDEIAAVINGRNPSIFGLQEASTTKDAYYSAQWLIRKFSPEYKVFRARGAIPKLIFYRASRFSIAKYNDGSPMAGQVSLPTDSQCGQPHRTISWAVLREKRSRDWYWVGNTHFPIGGECWSSRVHSANLIHWLIGRTNPRNYPVIVMGDFNNRAPQCIHHNAAVAGRPIARLVERPNARHVHNLDATLALNNCRQTLYGMWPAARPRPSRRIDFIFHSRQFEAWGATVDARRTVQRPWGGKTSPSDHYALVATLQARP